MSNQRKEITSIIIRTNYQINILLSPLRHLHLIPQQSNTLLK